MVSNLIQMQNSLLRTFNIDIIKDVARIEIYVRSNTISNMRINYIFCMAHTLFLSHIIYI